MDYPILPNLCKKTASNAANLQGQTPLGALTAKTPDISQYLDFGWYDWIWYRTNAGLDVPKLGRFLGVAKSASNMLTFHILPDSGIPIQAGTPQQVTEPEKQTDVVRKRIKNFSDKIADKFKDDRLFSLEPNQKRNLDDWSDVLETDPDFADEFNRLYDNTAVPEADDTFDPDTFDSFIGMELSVDRGDVHPMHTKVTKRLKDHRGNPIGTAHDKIMLDTRMYEVEFIDSTKQAMTANLIAENMFDTVKEECL